MRVSHEMAFSLRFSLCVRRDGQGAEGILGPGRSEVRILNEDRAGTGTGGQLVPANRPLVLAMAYEMLRSTVPESLVLMSESCRTAVC